MAVVRFSCGLGTRSARQSMTLPYTLGLLQFTHQLSPRPLARLVCEKINGIHL